MVIEHTQTGRPRSSLFAFTGGFVIVASLVIGFLGWFVLNTLADNARKHEVILSGLAVAAIENRTWFPLLVLPAVGCGVALIVSGVQPAITGQPDRPGRPRRGRWMLLTGASLWLIGCFLLILYCFIMFLAPIYQYQEL